MLPLVISTQRYDVTVTQAMLPGEGCAYCGLLAGLHGDSPQSCAICTLVRHLERPGIDEELTLIWLPEVSQAALVCVVREMHTCLRANGGGVDGVAYPAVVTAKDGAVHYTRAALSARSSRASEHLGTNSPSELSHILSRMSPASYARRHRLLAGLRVLPTGRFFVGAEDCYPEIVESWRTLPPAADALSTERSAA